MIVRIWYGQLLSKRDQDKRPNQMLGEVRSFKYLGFVISNKGSKPEILFRIAQTTAALSTLEPIWRDKNICLAS